MGGPEVRLEWGSSLKGLLDSPCPTIFDLDWWEFLIF